VQQQLKLEINYRYTEARFNYLLARKYKVNWYLLIKPCNKDVVVKVKALIMLINMM